MSELVLSGASRRAFERLASDSRRVFGHRFVSLLAYSPRHSLLFVAEIAPADLDALGSLTETWQHEGLEIPLVMTPGEFERSLDAFPLEYQAIVDRHVRIDGDDLVATVEVSRDDLRRACEVQAKAHLIHIRQGWMRAGGHVDEQAELLERSAVPLRALLTNIARLTGTPAADTAALAAGAHALFGVPASLIAAILALEEEPERSRHHVSQLAEYLAAAGQIWSTIDQWRAK